MCPRGPTNMGVLRNKSGLGIAPTQFLVFTGAHKRTFRIRSNVHSRISSTRNSVYSIYSYNFQEKQELVLHEIVLKYQGLQPIALTVISST